MKKSFNIIWMFLIIAAILVAMWYLLYRPQFSGVFSGQNTDWGGFGDFFWGFGMMCFTALNVYVFWQIEQQIRRDSFIRDLRSIIDKMRDAKSTNNEEALINSIESFKIAINTILSSGMVSRKAKKCIMPLFKKLQQGGIDKEIICILCEYITNAIIIDHKIDLAQFNPKLRGLEYLTTEERINRWEAQIATRENMPNESSYLRTEYQVLESLHRKFPNAEILLEVRIPKTSIVFDALIREDNKEDIIVEIKTKCDVQSIERGLTQIITYQQEYQKTFEKSAQGILVFAIDKRQNSESAMSLIAYNVQRAHQHQIEIILIRDKHIIEFPTRQKEIHEKNNNINN